jgi:hypothetical protein
MNSFEDCWKRKRGKRKFYMSTELEGSIIHGVGSDKETLYMLGGVAMIVFGAGLILSNPSIRRYMSQIGIGNLAQVAMPDAQHYLKMRAM